jgi:hypothetical protein
MKNQNNKTSVCYCSLKLNLCSAARVCDGDRTENVGNFGVCWLDWSRFFGEIINKQ